MKKLLLLLPILTAFTVASCGSDDDEDFAFGQGKPSEVIGTLHSDTSLDAELPEGYRISAVHNIQFNYDALGSLTSIKSRNVNLPFDVNTLVLGTGNNYSKLTLNGNNLITKIESSFHDEPYTIYDKEEGTLTFSYNSNNQLTSYKYHAEKERIYDGALDKRTEDATVKISYSGKKLKKIVEDFEEKMERLKKVNIYSEKNTHSYNYDEEYDNPFYQYTPHMVIDLSMGDLLKTFAYLGLLGRASSALPSSCDWSEECYEDGVPDKENGTGTSKRGPYSYNSYGALQKADGYDYSYKVISPSSVKQSYPTAMQTVGMSSFFMPSHRKTHE